MNAAYDNFKTRPSSASVLHESRINVKKRIRLLSANRARLVTDEKYKSVRFAANTNGDLI